MGITEYTLPEFVFLDGNSHLGNTLEDRTVLQHVRSNTILEVIRLDSVEIGQFTGQRHEFTYINHAGIKELHLFVVHVTLADELQEIFRKCEQFYLDYLRWEDKGIIEEHKTGMN